MANKIPPELNRARVKKSLDKVDRVYALLPKGTIDRIKKMGLVPGTFARILILDELDRLERSSKK